MSGKWLPMHMHGGEVGVSGQGGEVSHPKSRVPKTYPPSSCASPIPREPDMAPEKFESKNGLGGIMLGVGVVNTLELAGTAAALVWKKCWVNACFSFT